MAPDMIHRGLLATSTLGLIGLWTSLPPNCFADESSSRSLPCYAGGRLETVVLRLHPGDDLRLSLDRLAREQRWDAAVVLTCVGSLSHAALRFADQPEPSQLKGKFEITALTGTLSRHGSHMHLGIADAAGRAWGGHLVEGCRVYTTAEIVIGILPRVKFQRKLDPQTGYKELFIEEKPTRPSLSVDEPSDSPIAKAAHG
ncbi:MAG TPA: PPC domain-containing DNA-binding protein [Pirellulaceae bacterium]